MAKPPNPRTDLKPREADIVERPAPLIDAGESGGGEMRGDAALFRAAVGEVRPLRSAAKATGPAAGGRAIRRKNSIAGRGQPDEPLLPLPDPSGPQDLVGGSDPLSFQRPGVRNQDMRRLRRGSYGIEDELDLHGLNQAAARDILGEFLIHQRAAGRRCVRIVHGKGCRSGARGPVLKIAVNGWLKRHPDVIAFTSARSIDGGTGAVYVLLRA